MGVKPSCIASFNPIKTPAFVAAMQANGSTLMAVDSADEVDKAAALARDAEIAVRINVENEGSDWPLDDKFGVEPSEVVPLLRRAADRGLKPAGLTFHVGSQCRNANSWRLAIERCAAVWEQAAKAGIRLDVLSLGGGIPARHGRPTPTVDEIGRVICQALHDTGLTRGNGVRLIIEPGRGVVAEAAVMVTSVIAKANRAGGEWAFIDAGVFNGLMETIAGFQYELSTSRPDAPTRNITLAGPSCDSVDVMFRDLSLPAVEIGDRLYVHAAGAYTTVYASSFNGFAPPAVHILNA
jgi:ornithine decarboxylase